MIGYRRRLSGLYQDNSEEAGELRKGISLFFEHFRYIRRIFFFLKSFSWLHYKLESGQRKRKTSSAQFLVPNPAQFAIPISRPSARHDGQTSSPSYHYVLAAPCPCSQSEGEVAAVARGRAHVPERRGGGG